MDKPKSKPRDQSTNPLTVLFSITTPFEFVSRYSFDECLKRLAAKRTKNPRKRAQERLRNTLVVTVDISQDTPDSAKYVIEYRSAIVHRGGYYRKIEGRLERHDNMTFVQTSVPAFGPAFILSVGLGLWMLFQSSIGIVILICIAASLWAFAACYMDRRDLFNYIKRLFAYDAISTWSKAHPAYKIPKRFRLVDDGEVIPLEEQPAAQTSHHGSNSK